MRIIKEQTFYEMLEEEARKNTKTNKDGLTIITKKDPDYYDSIWDEEDSSIEESKKQEQIEPKVKDIWKVNYPYEENDGRGKARPALVLGVRDDFVKVMVMKITSNLERLLFNETKYDVELRDYKHEGLSEPLVARVDKVIEIDKSQFLYKYGKISDRDWRKVYDKFIAYKQNKNNKGE